MYFRAGSIRHDHPAPVALDNAAAKEASTFTMLSASWTCICLLLIESGNMLLNMYDFFILFSFANGGVSWVYCTPSLFSFTLWFFLA